METLGTGTVIGFPSCAGKRVINRIGEHNVLRLPVCGSYNVFNPHFWGLCIFRGVNSVRK